MKTVNDSGAKDTDYIIFRKSFRHWITKKIVVAPPGKVFAIHIRPKK